jgi:hypothetical protein
MEDKADLPSPTPHPLTPSQGDIVSPWFTWYATSLPRSAVVGLGTARREIPPSCPDSPVAKSVYAGQDVRDDALPQPSSRTLCRLTRTWSPAHLAKRRDLSACGRVAPELRLAPSSCDTAIPYETLHFLRVSCWIAARHVRRIKKTPRSNVPLRGGRGRGVATRQVKIAATPAGGGAPYDFVEILLSQRQPATAGPAVGVPGAKGIVARPRLTP